MGFSKDPGARKQHLDKLIKVGGSTHEMWAYMQCTIAVYEAHNDTTEQHCDQNDSPNTQQQAGTTTRRQSTLQQLLRSSSRQQQEQQQQQQRQICDVKLLCKCGAKLGSANPTQSWAAHKGKCPKWTAAGAVTDEGCASTQVATSNLLSPSQAPQPKRQRTEQHPGSSGSFAGGPDDADVLNAMQQELSGRRLTQTTLLDGTGMQKQKVNQAFQLAFTQGIIVAGISFNAASHPSIQQALRVGGLTVAHRDTMSGSHLRKLKADAQQYNQSLIDANDGGLVQVGFDGGRSKRLNEGDKTIAVTLNLPKGNAAFLDLIATNGITLDTAAYTELMDTTLKKAVPDLKKVTGFVHDLEAVVVSTVEQLRVDMPWVADIPCVAHGLNNFVKDLSSLPLFKEVFDGCHTMIKTILEHKDLRAKFKLMCSTAGCPMSLKLRPDHRFIYQADECDCVLKSLPAFSMVYMDGPMRLAYIDDQDFKLCASLVQDGLRTHASQTLSNALQAVVPALKTMAACVAEMEADKPMLSLAPSMFESVAKALQDMFTTLKTGLQGRAASQMKQLCEEVLGMLQARREQYIKPSGYLAATLDIFNTKREGSNFMLPDWLTEDKLSAIAQGDNILTGLDEDHAGKVELELRLLHATGWPAKAYELATIKKGDRREWGDASRRRLIWRLLMKEDYPLLSLLADRLLTQHATVCSVERAWSQVKLLYDPKRTRLSMDKAKDMLYVASTWRLQHKQELLASEKTETAFWVTPIEEENQQQDVVVLE